MKTTPGNLYPKGITKAHLIEGNIPEEYWSSDFSNYEGDTEALQEACKYLLNLKEYKVEGVGVVFAGKVGRGKTFLMAITLKYLIRANWTVWMTSLSELIELIKRSWDDKSLVNTIDDYRHVHFLGLDDLGKEHAGPTGFSQVTFDNLLRYRMQHRLPTLFTTNLTSKEIHQKYGEATLSLIEGKTKIILVNGQDYRRNVLKHDLI